MSSRARPLVAGTAIAVASTAWLLAGCSLPNSATARSTPTPASDQPYPSPSPTAPPTPTTPTAGATPTPPTTATATPSPRPTPTPSPKPTTTTDVVYGYLDSVRRTGDGYAVSYRPATRCLTVKAPTCKPKPDKQFADGSWLAEPAKTATRTPLAPKAVGSVTVKGKTVELSPTAMSPLPAPGGVVVDLRAAPVAVKIATAPAVTSITQLH